MRSCGWDCTCAACAAWTAWTACATCGCDTGGVASRAEGGGVDLGTAAQFSCESCGTFLTDSEPRLVWRGLAGLATEDDAFGSHPRKLWFSKLWKEGRKCEYPIMICDMPSKIIENPYELDFTMGFLRWTWHATRSIPYTTEFPMHLMFLSYLSNKYRIHSNKNLQLLALSQYSGPCMTNA